MNDLIAENIPNRFISIQQYGLIKVDKEITKGPELEKWANGLKTTSHPPTQTQYYPQM
jgi:hypothetical protein